MILQFKQIFNTTIMVGQFTSPLSLLQQNIDPQKLICPLKSTDLGSYLVIENEIDYNNKWCTFEVVDQNTFIVQCIYMGLLLIFSIVFIYLFCKMIKLRKNSANSAFFSAQFIQTYILISCWLLSTYVRVGLCITVYLKFISPAQLQDPSKQHTIAFWSAIYNFFNFFCAFIVDLLILIIPTHWINNILANIKESRLMSMNDRKKIDWFNITQKITRFYYLYLRNLVACVVFCEIFIFLYSKYSYRCQMPFYSYSFTVVETLFFLAYYFYAAYVVHFLQKINVITVRSEDLKRIIWEYRFLLIAIFTRLTLDIYSAYLQSPNNSSKGYNPNRNCYDQKVIEAQFFISLSLHHILMHLLPIIVVLFIYRPVVNNRPPSQIIVYVDINDHLLTQQPNASLSTTNGLQQNMLQSVRRSGASSIFTMNQQNKERK